MQLEMSKDTVAPQKSQVDLLQESKASVEEIISRMLSIKKQGDPKFENRELLSQMFLNFVDLRQANRAILIEEMKVKAETELSKSPMDFMALQLHNLMYEKSHYFKATKSSREFKSKYPNIDLISEQDFFRDAPEAIKSQMLSNDSSHDLMLKRLNFELHQFMAQKEAFEENIDLEVSGSLNDAQTYARQQEEQNSESSRLEEDDDGKRQRKKPNKEGSEEAGLYREHPLTIVLHVYDDETQDPKSRKPVGVKFEY